MSRPSLTTPLALTLALLAVFAFGAAACKKFDGPQTLQERIAAGREANQTAAASDTEGGAAGEAADEAAAEEPEEEPPPTFAEEAKGTLTAIAEGTKECVGEYVSRMDMKKIDDGFLPVNVNQMDKACREPIEVYKERGRKLVGKHPVLDAYLEHAAQMGDAYLRMSFKMKQLGARERWKVVEAIGTYRASVLEHAGRIAEGVREVGAWPDDTEAQTTVSAEKVSPEAYRARAGELVAWIGERLPKLVEAYDAHGYKPADLQESIHFFSFRFAYASAKRWYDVGVARFEALSCQGDEGACGKTKEAIQPVLEAAAAVFDQYQKGLRFYRGDYMKRLDKAVPVRDELHDLLKAYRKAARKSRL